MQGIQEKDSRIADSMTFTFRDRVPQSITLWATPYSWKTRVDYLSVFAEDQWTLDRLTLSLGLRYDGLRGSVPAQHLPAGPFVPERRLRGRSRTRRTSTTSILASAPRSTCSETADRVEGFAVPDRDLPGAGRIDPAEQSGQRDGHERDAHVGRRQPRLHPAGERARAAVERQLRQDRAEHLLRRRGDPRVAHSRIQLAGLGLDRARGQAEPVGARRLLPDLVRQLHRRRDNQAVDPAADYNPYCVTAPADARLPVRRRSRSAGSST